MKRPRRTLRYRGRTVRCEGWGTKEEPEITKTQSLGQGSYRVEIRICEEGAIWLVLASLQEEPTWPPNRPLRSGCHLASSTGMSTWGFLRLVPCQKNCLDSGPVTERNCYCEEILLESWEAHRTQTKRSKSLFPLSVPFARAWQICKASMHIKALVSNY